MNHKAATVRLPANNVSVAIGFDLFQHHEELHWETGHHRVVMGRVEDELFFTGSAFVGVIMVVMLYDNELITALGALGVGSAVFDSISLGHVEPWWCREGAVIGDAHSIGDRVWCYESGA